MNWRTALLAQLEPAPRDIGTNLTRAVKVVSEHPEADLVVFPELFLSGYELEDVGRLALDPAGAELTRLREVAAESATAVVIGFPERVAGGVANSAACIDAEGRLAGLYRKVFLFGQEAKAFVPGERFVVVELDRERVAPLICFDVEFPEAARAVAQAGARLLITIAANMKPYFEDHELHSRARALENRLQHLYVNRVGSESGFDFVGGSRSVGPTGAIVAEAGEGEEVLPAKVVEITGFDNQVDYPRFLGALPTVDVDLAGAQGQKHREADVVAGDR